MQIICKKCHSQYSLDSSLVSPKGTPVKCTNCGNVFNAFPPENQVIDLTNVTVSSKNSSVVTKTHSSNPPPMPTLKDNARPSLASKLTPGSMPPPPRVNTGTKFLPRNVPQNTVSKKKYESLTKQFEQNSQELNRLSFENKQYEQRNDQLHSELAQHKILREQYERDVTKLEKEIRKKQNEIDRERDAKNKAELEIETVRNELEKRKSINEDIRIHSASAKEAKASLYQLKNKQIIDSDTQKARRNFVLFSAIGIMIASGSLMPSEITTFGFKFNKIQPHIVYLWILIAILYLGIVFVLKSYRNFKTWKEELLEAETRLNIIEKNMPKYAKTPINDLYCYFHNCNPIIWKNGIADICFPVFLSIIAIGFCLYACVRWSN